ncbi:MAG: type II CRISPR-associated endonuclease Cas1 [Mycoplasmatales bacterium]
MNIDNFDYIVAKVAKIYFNELFGNDFVKFENDEINTSLNYGYAILRGIIKQTIIAKGLIPPLGLWHKSQFNNYNLADDIIEVFRPLVDYVTFHFVIKDDNFTSEERSYLQRVIFQKVKYNNSNLEYVDCLNIYIDQIAKYMNKEIKDITFPITDSELYEY